MVEAHQGCRSNSPPAWPGSEVRGGSRSPVWRVSRPEIRLPRTRHPPPHTPTAAGYKTTKLCYFFPCASTPKPPPLHTTGSQRGRWKDQEGAGVTSFHTRHCHLGEKTKQKPRPCHKKHPKSNNNRNRTPQNPRHTFSQDVQRLDNGFLS